MGIRFVWITLLDMAMFDLHVVNIHLVHQAHTHTYIYTQVHECAYKIQPPSTNTNCSLTNIDPAKQIQVGCLEDYSPLYKHWRFSGFMLVGRMVHHVHHIL